MASWPAIVPAVTPAGKVPEPPEFVDAELRAGKQVVLRDPDRQDQLVKIFL
ncbi:hypothetical protein [Amycolatopsis sp. WAC 01416]|uniref:hypothetical protein n=1 Tax=Amycolatopsis sp. WAC 01416 TaxID=2203196 RepID=UPI0013155A13|nr:hypothetical protein [Amycolatopsis sp. WAC 01416]